MTLRRKRSSETAGGSLVKRACVLAVLLIARSTVACTVVLQPVVFYSAAHFWADVFICWKTGTRRMTLCHNWNWALGCFCFVLSDIFFVATGIVIRSYFKRWWCWFSCWPAGSSEEEQEEEEEEEQ